MISSPSEPKTAFHALVLIWTVFKILARLAYRREKLPALDRVRLICSFDYGEPYSEFVFDLHDHAIWRTLKPIGVEFTVECCKGHWDPSSGDYDLNALDLAAWQGSLGPPITGTCSKPLTFNMSYKY